MRVSKKPVTGRKFLLANAVPGALSPLFPNQNLKEYTMATKKKAKKAAKKKTAKKKK
jgi:hypothetical protein